MFDYIIIDAPPLGIFTDANVLMDRADGALLVIRACKTRYNVVDKLMEQIPKERMMGVVLNRAEEQPDVTSYYYQHRYYNRERLSSAPTQPLPVDQKEEEVVAVN
jgi:Mrp family chromosome partitioning ATPase